MNKICNSFLSFGLVIQPFSTGKIFLKLFVSKAEYIPRFIESTVPFTFAVQLCFNRGLFDLCDKGGKISHKKDRRGTSGLR